MRFRLHFLLPLVLAAAASPASGAGFRKAYFSKTTEGASARFKLTDRISKSVSDYRYTRLKSEEGKERLEIRVEITSGEFKGTKSASVYVLDKGYSLENDALSYGRAIVAMTNLSGDGEASEIPAETIPAIREAMIDYAGIVKFEGTEKLDGIPCDRYSYSKKRTGDPATVESGKLWLDPTIPFAIRRQEATIRETTGKTISSYEMTFEAGGAAAAEAQAESKPSAGAKPGPIPILEAYRRGEVGLAVRVVEGSRDGEELTLEILNKTDAALSVVLPKGRTVFEAGSPVGELHVAAAEETILPIPAGGTSAAVEVSQEGRKRAVEGRFTISVHEGTPLFSGSVTVGNVEEP